MNFDILKIAVAAGGLAGLACLIDPLASARHAEWQTTFDSVRPFKAEQASLGILAGFRGLAADVAWLRGYLAWEQHDAMKTEVALQLATALDGRPLCFWINGARIIAYDMPAWEQAAGEHPVVSSPVEQRMIDEKYARRALAYLETATRRHPRRAVLLIERANIELGRLHDPLAAAESYRRASELPDAPFYAARLHAELLHRAGHASEALAWLKRLYPGLPKHVEAAAAPVVLARIQALEQELSVPIESRFVARGERPVRSVGL